MAAEFELKRRIGCRLREVSFRSTTVPVVHVKDTTGTVVLRNYTRLVRLSTTTAIARSSVANVLLRTVPFDVFSCAELTEDHRLFQRLDTLSHANRGTVWAARRHILNTLFGVEAPSQSETPLQYAITFSVLAAACVAAVRRLGVVGWAAVLPLYAALSFVLLAVAYAGVGPRLCSSGRPAAGRAGMAAVCPVLPAQRPDVRSLPAAVPRAGVCIGRPNLFFGRRLSARSLMAGGRASSTWPASSRRRGGAAGYRSLPVLTQPPRPRTSCGRP